MGVGGGGGDFFSSSPLKVQPACRKWKNENEANRRRSSVMLELCESRLLKWMPLTVRRSLDIKQQLLLLFLLLLPLFLLLLLPLIIRRHPVQAIQVIDLDIDLKKKKNAERLVWLSPTGRSSH